MADTTNSSRGAAYAFVTLVTTDDYLPAALVVAHSLRLAHAQSSLLSQEDRQALSIDYDDRTVAPQLGPWQKDAASVSTPSSNIHLVVLVTPASLSVQTIRVLLTVFDRVVGVEPLGIESILAMQQLGQIPQSQEQQQQQQEQPDGQDVVRRNNDNLALLGRLDLGYHSGAALTKLHAWRLTDYDKVVYLDADTLILNPLAHLFTRSQSFAAAPDTGWPDIFNSGVMLLTPAEATFTSLIQLAATTGSWDGADQGLLNEYFGGEIGSGSEGPGGGWARLGFLYNTTALGGYTYAPAFRRFGSKVNVAHFIGENKPWRDRRAGTAQPTSAPSVPSDSLSLTSTGSESKGMAARWWDVYNSYYPLATGAASNGDSNGHDSESDLELKITEHGVEIIERPKKKESLQVPTFQAAWDSLGSTVGDSSSRRGATVDELKAMFHTDAGSKITTGRMSEGQYESLPLFGRLDLLAPIFDYVAAKKVSTPPTPTQQHHDLEIAPWNAALGPPPSITGPQGHQMRNPVDAFYPNAWDQPVDRRAEAERRRQFFNANACTQAQGRGWGYIPPEAREIHTFSHLGGDLPDEQKVKAIFPWEEQAQRRSPPPPSSRTPATTAPYNDPSLGLGSRHATVTRRFDNHVVGAVPGDGRNSASLVSRYGNVWDEEGLSVGPQFTLTSADATDENGRQGLSSTSAGGWARRRQPSKTQDSGGITRSRPTTHYVPNNYEQYVPAPPQGQPPLSSAASDGSIDDSINDELNYPLHLGGGGGAGAGVGGFGEVEGSGSWASSLSDIVRLSKANVGTSLAGGRGGGPGQSGGSRRTRVAGGGLSSGAGTGQSHYGGLEADGDGDDESSTEEDDSRTSSIQRRSRQSTVTGGLSPHLGSTPGGDLASVGSYPSSSTALSPTLESLSSSTSTTNSSSGTTSSATAATTGTSAALPIPGTSPYGSGSNREGPGYARKSQQSEYVRANLTPRSPRPGGLSSSGSGTFNTNLPLPSTSPPTLSRGNSGTSVAERIAQLQAAGSPPRTSASVGGATGGIGRPLGRQGSVKAAVAAASAAPTPAPAPPLTGRARIRPERLGSATREAAGRGRGSGGAAGNP